MWMGSEGHHLTETPMPNHHAPRPVSLCPRAVAFFCLSVAGGAHAVAIDDISVDGAGRAQASRASCDDGVALSVDLSAVDEDDAPDGALYLRWLKVNATVCPREVSVADDVIAVVRVVAAADTISSDIDVSAVELAGANACPADPSAGVTFSWQLCVQVLSEEPDLAVGDEAIVVAGIPLAIDTQVPDPPAIAELSGASDSINLEVERDVGATRVRIEARRCRTSTAVAAAEGEGEDEGEGDATDAGDLDCSGAVEDAEGQGTSVRLAGLTPNAIYEVSARLIDAVGNVSAPSEGVRVELNDVLGVLDLVDPIDVASCAAVGGEGAFVVFSGVGGVGVFGVFGGRRRRGHRRRRCWHAGTSAGLMVGLVMSGAAGSRAQTFLPPPAPEVPASPLDDEARLTGSLSAGLHVPDMDRYSAFPVWACQFRDAPLVKVGGDADVHLLDTFGSLQLTLGVEGGMATGAAQPSTALQLGACQEPTTTELQVLMVLGRTGLTWRIDPLLDWYGVPVVPYVRAGVLLGWIMLTRGGALETRNPITGADGGIRGGVEGALGVMMALDIFDREATKKARSASGIQHGFIFIEAAAKDLSLLGAQPVMTPTDRLLSTGLPLAWRAGVAVELL